MNPWSLLVLPFGSWVLVLLFFGWDYYRQGQHNRADFCMSLAQIIVLLGIAAILAFK